MAGLHGSGLVLHHWLEFSGRKVGQKAACRVAGNITWCRNLGDHTTLILRLYEYRVGGMRFPWVIMGMNYIPSPRYPFEVLRLAGRRHDPGRSLNQAGSASRALHIGIMECMAMVETSVCTCVCASTCLALCRHTLHTIQRMHLAGFV